MALMAHYEYNEIIDYLSSKNWPTFLGFSYHLTIVLYLAYHINSIPCRCVKDKLIEWTQVEFLCFFKNSSSLNVFLCINIPEIKFLLYTILLSLILVLKS